MDAEIDLANSVINSLSSGDYWQTIALVLTGGIAMVLRELIIKCVKSVPRVIRDFCTGGSPEKRLHNDLENICATMPYPVCGVEVHLLTRDLLTPIHVDRASWVQSPEHDEVKVIRAVHCNASINTESWVDIDNTGMNKFSYSMIVLMSSKGVDFVYALMYPSRYATDKTVVEEIKVHAKRAVHSVYKSVDKFIDQRYING